MSGRSTALRRRFVALGDDATQLRGDLASGGLRRLSEAERARCRDALAELADAILGIGELLEEPGLDTLAMAKREAPFARREAE